MSNTFIPWTGGEQPVPDLTRVQVQFRNPNHTTDENFFSQELDWIHISDDIDSDYDIVGYRLSDEQPDFISWSGGNNPVGDAFVDVIYREDQSVVYENVNASNLNWSHDPSDSTADIVRYHVIG